MRESGGVFLGILSLLLNIGLGIGSGFLAWNWVEPASFWGAVLFLLAWSIMARIGYTIAMGIVVLVGSLFD